MPKKDYDDYMISETGNWNVADQYTKHKIMKPLNLCDYYEDIANFGYESIIDEIINYNSIPNDIIKIKALYRLIKQLIRVIDNTKFALKKKGTKEEVLKYKKTLKTLIENFPRIIIKSNQSGNLRIRDYELFQNILDQVSEIKSKINEPLNANHLIFTDTEEFDPIAFKDRKKRRMEIEG